MRKPALLALVVLAACGPVSLAEAERICFERARLAQQPRGEVAVGIGSDGRAAAGVSVQISGDFLAGRDPSAVYETCVMSKSGEPPSRPLHARSDWKG